MTSWHSVAQSTYFPVTNVLFHWQATINIFFSSSWYTGTTDTGRSAAAVDNAETYNIETLFFFIWILQPVKIISLILWQINRLMGRKWEITEKNHMTTHKQNFAYLAWPKLGSNPQRWDDKWFRALKISGLNHSATGAAPLFYRDWQLANSISKMQSDSRKQRQKAFRNNWNMPIDLSTLIIH